MSNDTGGAGLAVYAYAAYITEALVIAPANLLVAMSILRYTALRRRKEYNLLMALSVADAINLIAYMLAGSLRLVLHFERRANELVSSRYCLKQPYTLLWSFSDHNAQLMLVVVSVDRLLSVAIPTRYIKFTKQYARRMVGSAYALTMLIGAVGYYISYNRPQDDLISIMCYGISVYQDSSMLAKMFLYYYEHVPQALAISSILIFVLIMPVYLYQKGQVTNAGISEKQKLEQQRKITKSLAISCVCTLCLYLIPFRLAFYAYGKGEVLVAYGLWAFSLNNALANVFIYELRHPEMLHALKSMLICKELPGNLRLWNLGDQSAKNDRSIAKRKSQQAWKDNESENDV